MKVFTAQLLRRPMKKSDTLCRPNTCGNPRGTLNLRFDVCLPRCIKTNEERAVQSPFLGGCGEPYILIAIIENQRDGLFIIGWKRHCSKDPEFDLDRAGAPFYTAAPNLFPGSQRCMDRADTCQTPPRGLSMSRTSPNLNGDFITATINKRPVLAVASSPLATNPTSASYMIWAMYATGRPVDLLVSYSSHHCSTCKKYFNIDLSDLAPPGSHYTHRVIDLAVRVVVEDGLPYRPASWHLWRDHRVFVPFATIQNWVEAGGKKGARAHGRRVSGVGT